MSRWWCEKRHTPPTFFLFSARFFSFQRRSFLYPHFSSPRDCSPLNVALEEIFFSLLIGTHTFEGNNFSLGFLGSLLRLFNFVARRGALVFSTRQSFAWVLFSPVSGRSECRNVSASPLTPFVTFFTPPFLFRIERNPLSFLALVSFPLCPSLGFPVSHYLFLAAVSAC